MQQQFPQAKLTVRNLCWPADEVVLRPRPDNFGDLEQHLNYFKADLIIAAFGYNESFDGQSGLEAFKKNLGRFLSFHTTKAFNGKSAPQLVLLSPVANEDLSNTNAATRNNANLKLYADAMKELAKVHQVGYVDVLTGTLDKSKGTTIDGNALNAKGHRQFARLASEGLFGKEAPEVNEELRGLVIDKATQFSLRYRPLNTFYYVGGRNKSYGYLDFLPAMRNFDRMVATRDQAIHATAATGKLVKPDDSMIPQLEDVKLARGANKFFSVADEKKAFKIDPRFEVNCFASEEDFPEMACPISMRWDGKGRLWVSTSVTYPHIYPGQKPMDKIIILEDTNNDGKADQCTTWAEGLHIPLSFVLDGNGGVYCSEQPHITHLTDTNGDGKMDHREIVLTGFGCEDSHHSIHDLIWTPGGKLMFREAIFHHSQVETSYGPVRAKNSSWFLYCPKTKKLTTFGSYPNTNPWGVTYDKWGNHIASHPVFASTFHATNPAYPRENMSPGDGFTQELGQHPRAPKAIQAYSGVCGHGFVDFPQWPAEMQGGFIKNRYKPTNNVEIHSYTEQADHFAEKKLSNLIFSSNLSFIPVDFQFGPTGAAYICDWYNPVKGHAQYSLRDPRRDRKAGRIWRVVPKKFVPLAKLDYKSASIEQLLSYLEAKPSKVREWARRELRARDHAKVAVALDTWGMDSKDESLLLEILWVRQGIDAPDTNLLGKLIAADNHLVAAAAFGVLRFWYDRMDESEVVKLLHSGAVNPSQHVRREAVITASYVGSEKAFIAVQPVMDQAAGVHLQYAIQTSFESGELRPFWTADTKSRITKLGTKEAVNKDVRTAEQRKFDKQKNLINVTIGCVPERIMYDTESFKVKAGEPVRLTLNNPDATQHNLLILEKNTPPQDIGMKANDMARDPEAAKKDYIPVDKRILFHTKLLSEHSSETLRFIAPKAPGKYPYICTFPGHWTVMKGVMIVE